MIWATKHVRLSIAERRTKMIAHAETDRGEKIRREGYKRQVVELRQTGLTYKEIGEQIGISRGYACNLYQQAVREVHGENQHEVAEHLEREWLITEQLMEQFLPDALDGDARAFECVLKLLNRRAKYRGLDAPTKVDARVNGGVQPRTLAPEQMKAEIMERLAGLRAANGNGDPGVE